MAKENLLPFVFTSQMKACTEILVQVCARHHIIPELSKSPSGSNDLVKVSCTMTQAAAIKAEWLERMSVRDEGFTPKPFEISKKNERCGVAVLIEDEVFGQYVIVAPTPEALKLIATHIGRITTDITSINQVKLTPKK